MLNIPVFIIATFSAVTALWKGTRMPLIWDWDYSYFIENAYRVYLGQIPYKDFILVLTPGTYFVSGLIMKLFGVSYLPHVIYIMVVSFFTVIITYKILSLVSTNKTVNILSLLPLVFSGHAIYAFASYDVNAVFLSLVAIYYILRLNQRKNQKIRQYFIAGALISLPSLFKQNIGLIFFMLMTAYEYFHVYLIDKRNFLRKSLAITFGWITVFSLFIFYLVTSNSLNAFIFQAFIFPMRIRLVREVFDMAVFDVFRMRSLLYYLPYIGIVLLILRKRATNKIIYWATLYSVFLSPLIYILYLYLRYRNAVGDISFIVGYAYMYMTSIWHVLFATLLFLLAREFMQFKWGKQKAISSFVFSLAIVLYAISPLMLHRIESASYPFYPLFALLLVIILNKLNVSFPRYNWNKGAGAISIGVALYLLLFMFQGDLAKYLQTKEIRMKPGPAEWISEIEKVQTYVGKTIPMNDSIVSIPGQDTFYYISNRKPPLPYFQFFSQTFPYTARYYYEAIEKVKVDWVIIKSKRRYVDNIGVGDIDFIEEHLKNNYLLNKQIADYNIYKRIQDR